jgi:hypothetical protein
MQSTSVTYAPYADSRQCDIRVSFRLIDNDAYSDATATATQYNTDVSQLTQTHDLVEGMGAKYATLETHGWPLDGTCDIMPDSVSGIQTGFWSVPSGADGTFETDPTLTFVFTSDHSSVGFTVIFDDKANRFPKTMTVTAYDSSDAELDSDTVTVTSARQVVDLPVENYRKIVISFSETREPYQRVRVSEVVFGVVQYFDNDNTSGATLLYGVSPAAENLPSNELTITFDNTDAKYNMVSPSSVFAYLQQGQSIAAELGIGLEYINMGKFYFAKAEAQDGSMTARITAYDRLYQLDKSICGIGTTGTWTVADAVAAVITDSGLLITTDIPAATGALTINKCIPTGTTHREALRLIAQAAMCTCYFDRDDVLIFAEVAAGTAVDTLDADNMHDYPQIEITDRINTVELTVRDEYAETENIYTAADVEPGETAQVWSVDNPLVYDGNTVAAWLLDMAQMRTKYKITERGNPAREIMDTATIYDAYGGHADAVIIKQDYVFDGGLTCNTEAVG